MAWSATFAATVAVGVGLALAKAERERRAAREEPLPERDRHFGLLPDEPPADGLRRIALGQLDLAIELLRGNASAVPPEQAVHETRKALKRLRALLRLIEDELPAKRCARERAVLRDAARRLSGARDAEVVLSTLDALLARHPRKLGDRRALVQLRRRLERERRAATARTLGDAATRSQVAHELSDVRARVARWRLSTSDDPAHKLVRPGLRRIYRAGAAGRRRAARRKSSPVAMHRWRKHVKDLRYALEVLDVQDRSDKRIAKLARRADTLGELLGEEHDLMLLAERARSYKPLRRRRRARKQLLRAISRRRAVLRKRALRDGKRLYERKPRRFVRRLCP